MPKYKYVDGEKYRVVPQSVLGYALVREGSESGGVFFVEGSYTEQNVTITTPLADIDSALSDGKSVVAHLTTTSSGQTVHSYIPLYDVFEGSTQDLYEFKLIDANQAGENTISIHWLYLYYDNGWAWEDKTYLVTGSEPT